MPVDGEVDILTLPRRTSSHHYFCVRMIKEEFALVLLGLTTWHVAKSRSITPTVPKRQNVLKSFAEYAKFFVAAFGLLIKDA